MFTEHIRAGKGVVARAATLLGRWNLLGATLARLAFGIADAIRLGSRFGRPEIPDRLFSILPFAAALPARVFFSGRVLAPAAVGKKFERSGR